MLYHSNVYLISLSNLDNVWILWEKLHVNHILILVNFRMYRVNEPPQHGKNTVF